MARLEPFACHRRPSKLRNQIVPLPLGRHMPTCWAQAPVVVDRIPIVQSAVFLQSDQWITGIDVRRVIVAAVVLSIHSCCTIIGVVPLAVRQIGRNVVTIAVRKGPQVFCKPAPSFKRNGAVIVSGVGHEIATLPLGTTQTIRTKQIKQIVQLHTSIKIGIGWNGNDARLCFNVPNGAQTAELRRLRASLLSKPVSMR